MTGSGDALGADAGIRREDRNCWSSPLDPMAYPPDRRNLNKRMLIDACRPWNRRDTFPKVAEAGAELKERVRKRWPGLCDF